MSDLSADRAELLMATPKFCAAALRWEDRSNHVGMLRASAQPEDDTGAILPGLTLQLDVKRSIVVDRCLYELGLFLLDGGVRRRVYQLNVCPPDKRSHQDASVVIHGPHEHVGTGVSAVSDPTICCGEMGVAFAHFCKRINLTFGGQLNSPV